MQKHSIVTMQEWAEQREGMCLSETYVNSGTPIKWQCKFGHVWEAVPDSIKAGHWCPYCAGLARKTIEDMNMIASERGGKCLSIEYENNRTKLKWQCADGHVWEATPHSIIAGSWCPQCNFYYTEEKCRYIFEGLLNAKFVKSRAVLKGFELDGYNRTLDLAFEFHGKQHYKHESHFFKTQEDFQKRVEMDMEKERLCVERGIQLIVIPYDIVTSDQRLLEYIYEKLLALGIRPFNKSSDFAFDGFYERLSVLKELEILAQSKGGKCLAKTYAGNKEKIKWQCSEGHIFRMNVNNVRNDHWCPICVGLIPLNIEQMRRLASERGGKCLSEDYFNNKTPLKWQCAEGHVWEARPDSVKNGKWCIICSGRNRLTIEELQKLAQSRGGKCLSTEYRNLEQKLEWECNEGHRWKASTHSVKTAGNWCPVCSRCAKRTIEEMREFAKTKGGECISESYINNKSPLQWKCSEGHTWMASAGNVIKGTWCPVCSRIKKSEIATPPNKFANNET